MMKSKLATAIALVGLMQTSVLYALGLGDIRVSSAVNERLDAEIPLINANGLDASQVLVSLASKADFARAGVDRNYFLSSLEFIVERGESGTPILRLQTPDVVLEPYLNFLVELRWPKGRLLREYAVLLDLPNYSAAPARAVNPATVTDIPPVNPSNKKVTKTNTQSFTPSSPSSTNQSPQNKVSAKTPSNVTVRADETLWGIAKRVKPNGTSINQTMLALQDLNPNAFINNNINLLKKGAVLRLPEDATVSRVSDKEAQQLMAKQQALPLLASQAADLNAPNLKATQDARDTTYASASESTVVEGQLQLATVDSSPASTTLSNVDINNDSTQLSQGQNNLVEVDRLRNELAISLENLDRAAVENTAMDTRLVAMESQLSDLEQLVSLKDQELASMRLAIEARRAALDTSQVNEQASKSKASTPVVETGPLDAIASALSISIEWVIGIGVTFFAAVTAILMWFFARRDDAYEATVFERVEPLTDDEELEENFYADKNARSNTNGLDQQKTQTKEDLSDQNTHDDLLDNGSDPSEGHSAGHSENNDGSTLAHNRDGNVVASDTANNDYDAERDVIAEADIYLAYGRYEQASEMLAAAIEHEPTRSDLQLKQLELFVAQQTPDLFRNACQALLTLDPTLNVSAEALLSDVESISDWWPEGDFSAPAETFVDSYIDDVEEGELEKSEKSETDGSNFGLQLAYDADSEIESEEGGLEADVGSQNRNNDEVGTKLDLARAYIDMGDIEGAREILDEVMSEGSEEQRDQANAMIGKIA